MASSGFSQQVSMFLEYSPAQIPSMPQVHLDGLEYRGRWAQSSLSTMALSLFFSSSSDIYF